MVQEGERIALVGDNGAGKSSLLRMLAVLPGSARIGYLAQHTADETHETLDELIERALAAIPDEAWGERNKRLRAMLAAFGFTQADHKRPLAEFSGGQRAKAALAHVLLDDPDLLILDEPTNHLDIATVRWLEDYIVQDRRAYLIVSHDRYFIDRTATRVWELDRGELHAYEPAQPAYSQFLQQRAARLEKQRQAYETFVAEREKRAATISGLRTTLTSSNYSRVRSREKQFARLEARAVAPPPPSSRSIGVRLASSRRATSGFAFEARSLGKAYQSALFTDLSLDVQQGERIAIVGPNGAGKSTLLKILAHEILPDRGSLTYNPAAKIAYYAQNAHDQLNVRASAVEAVMDGQSISHEDARSLLGRMLLSGEAADKPVEAFSGGERRRIMLARLMAGSADVLLLDEPTNDLDIASRDALEGVLDDYEGAIVVVSHDRYLLARLADRVVWIDAGKHGIVNSFDAYERSQHMREDVPAVSSSRVKGSRLTPLKVRSNLETQIARLEREIARMDARRVEIEAIFAGVEVYADAGRVKALQAELATLQTENAAALERWEHLTLELEMLP